MKIRLKLLLIYLATSIFMIIIGAGAILFFSNAYLKQSAFNNIEAVVNSKASRVLDLLEEEKREILFMSKDHHFSDFLLASSVEETFSKTHTYDILESFLNHEEFIEVFVLNERGEIVISTNRSFEGKTQSDQDYFIDAKEKPYVSDIKKSELSGVISSIVSAPVFDNKTSKFLGVVAKEYRTGRLDNLIIDNVGLGETGEVYLINKELFPVVSSRFEKDIALEKTIDTYNSKNCFDMAMVEQPMELHRQEHSKFKIFTNHRGVDVLGSHAYIPERQWCLLVEIEKNEVFELIDRLSGVALAIGFFVSIIVFLVSKWLGFIIIRPIEDLRKGVQIIEKGDFEYKVGTKEKDEIGELSRAFDKMVKAVKKSKKEVDKKVEEQTKEIVLKQEGLEEQQVAILNVLEDVEREKQKTLLEKDKINTILYSIGDGVFVVDNDLKIVIFNQSASDISGFSAEEVVGKKYSDVLKFLSEKDNKPSDQFILNTFKTEKVQVMTDNSILVKKDGSRVPVADSSAPIRDKNNNVSGAVIVFRDITRRREVEKLKSEFVSVASHQLRTPLTGVQWVSERLLKTSKNLNKKEKQYVNDIYLSSRRLSRLVDDLLNVSRIEEGRVIVRPEEMDVVKFISGYLEEVRPLFAQKNIQLKFKTPKKIDVIFDRIALQNIVQSLVSNAIEYTHNDGKVDILLKKVGKNFSLRIEDTGIGIPKADQKTIFEKFTRGANALTVKTDGTGLGLYIVKQTVELLGGSIKFESIEDKGTTFYVELPLKTEVSKKS